jgi:hypothetical protein
MTHNCFSFFRQQHNHPEYSYTNKTPHILLDINPGESSPVCTTNEMTTQSITCNSLTPPCHSHNDVNAAIEDNCNEIRYALTKPEVPSKHNAFLAVLICRLSLLPKNNLAIAPETPTPGNSDITSDSDKCNLNWQKRPKIHQFLPLSPFLLTLLNIFQQKINKSSTAFLTRSRTNFNTKNTLI